MRWNIFKNQKASELSEYLFGLSQKKLDEKITEMYDTILQNKSAVKESQIYSTAQVKTAVKSWKEKDTNLNLLQLAVIYGNLETVQLLIRKYVYDFGDKEECQGVNLPWEYKVHQSAPIFAHVNTPLFLASKLGHLEIIKLIFSTSGNDDSYLLEERGIVKISNATIVKHNHVFKNMNKNSPGANTHTSTKQPTHMNDRNAAGENNTDLVLTQQHSNNTTHEPGQQEEPAHAHTAFEICVQEGHLQCCIFLAERFLYRKDYHNYFSSTHDAARALQIASHLKWPPYLHMLLSNETYRKEVNTLNQYGCPPIWLALASKQCVKLLLKHGANPNVTIAKQSILQILLLQKYNFSDTASLVRAFETAQLLLEYGVNVNWMDQSQNTALDYVLEQCWQEWTSHDTVKNEKLKEFVALLLDHGASTVIRCEKSNSVIRTVAGSYIHKHHFLPTDFTVVYSMLSLLFERGSLDPNLIPDGKNNLIASLLLETKWMSDWEVQNQCSLLHLLYINGANFNQIPLPFYIMQDTTSYYDVIGYKELPLVLAFYKKYDVAVLKKIMDFMSLSAINQSWERFAHLRSLTNIHTLVHLVQSYHVPVLSHLCKLIIIACLGKQATSKIQRLHLPEVLKECLVSDISFNDL